MQRDGFLSAAAKNVRIATFQPHDRATGLSFADESSINLGLGNNHCVISPSPRGALASALRQAQQ